MRHSVSATVISTPVANLVGIRDTDSFNFGVEFFFLSRVGVAISHPQGASKNHWAHYGLHLVICSVLFCSLAFLDPGVGHTMDVLSPFISILCHSD